MSLTVIADTVVGDVPAWNHRFICADANGEIGKYRRARVRVTTFRIIVTRAGDAAVVSADDPIREIVQRAARIWKNFRFSQ